MEHDAQMTQSLGGEETCQQVDAGFFVKARRRKIPIKNQDLVLGASDDDIAGVTVVGLGGD